MKLGIGPTLKQLRKEQCLNQKDVANFLQISRPTYIRYEKEMLEIPLSKLLELRNLFHFDLCKLINELEQNMIKDHFNNIVPRASSSPNNAA